MKSLNPYLTMNALRDDSVFVGRTYETTAILSRIYSAQPQSVEVIGERRIGKSSLLYSIQRAIRAAAPPDVVFVFVDGQIFAETEPGKFFGEIIGQILLHKKLAGTFESSYDGFSKLVTAIDQERLKLIIIIDEFDVITQNSRFKLEFFNFLRSKANNHQVAYILSTSRELESVCHSSDVAGSPFFNIFFRLHLGPLTLEEAGKLIGLPSAKAGVELSQFKDWIIDLAGTFPLYLQMTCSRIVDYLLGDPAAAINPQRIQIEVGRDLERHFEHSWRSLDESARNTLITVAAGGVLSDEEEPLRDILISRGYITLSSGAPTITSRLLREFILRRSGRLYNNSLILYLEMEGQTGDLDRVIRLIRAGDGTVISTEAVLVATFRDFDKGIGACVSLRELLDENRVRFRVATISYSEAEGLTRARQLCSQIISVLDFGEIATTVKVMSSLSKTLARRFRKATIHRDVHGDLPKLLTMLRAAAISPRTVLFGVPAPKTNNVWYEYRRSDTVFVFVHGIFSDSAGCWMNDRTKTFWPDLVRSDPRLRAPAIFLGGYYTDIGSDIYDLDNCEHELFSAMSRPSVNPSLPPVMQWAKIVFVCHSTGGIVVRYMLERRHELFASKRVGVMLVASPSFGASLANKLDWLARFYKNRLGRQLQWGSWSLQELDSRFKALIHDRKIPYLVGIEAYENKFIIHRKFIPNLTYVVSEESAGRYFGPPVLLRDTDHFSAAKPDSRSHPSHETLVDFYINEFDKSEAVPEVSEAESA